MRFRNHADLPYFSRGPLSPEVSSAKFELRRTGGDRHTPKNHSGFSARETDAFALTKRSVLDETSAEKVEKSCWEAVWAWVSPTFRVLCHFESRLCRIQSFAERGP